jgi:hypothetical protein
MSPVATRPAKGMLHYPAHPVRGGRRMAMYDDKKIQNLVKKMQKQARPKAEFGKVYDKTSTATSSSRK